MGVWAGTFPVEMNVPDPFPAILAIHCCCHDLLSTKLCTVILCTGDFYAACLGFFWPLMLLQRGYPYNSLSVGFYNYKAQVY